MNDRLGDGVSERLAELNAEGLPLVSRPFGAIAAALGTSEADVLARLKQLRTTYAVRRISASFDAARLGYHATLGALALPEERAEAAAAALAALPSVTHVFEVDDRYRLWYALAASSPARVEAIESEIVVRTGIADRLRVFPAELVKVTASFDADGVPDSLGPGTASTEGIDLSRDERALVRLLQGELPLVERPFAALTATLHQCGYDADERWVLERLESFSADGVLACIGATVRTRAEPWRIAAAVWPAVPAPDEAAELIACFPEVLHCFERRIPGDGASIVSVLEVRDRPALDRTVGRIRSASGLDDPRVLYPVREFKRAAMKYFAEGEC